MKESSKREKESEAKDKKEITTREYSPAEKAALEEYDRRKKASLKQVEFKYEKGKDGKLTFTQIGTPLAIVTLAKTTGTVHQDLSLNLVKHATLASTSSEDAENLGKTFNVVLAALLDIEPRDGLEGLLASQMVACHNQSMTLLQKALISKYVSQTETYLGLANKLMRTFAAQMETLKKYRSSGQQKVIVEHVHVSKGGKAVVGTINQGGGGICEKKSR